jgi:hypothetical protein
MSECGHLVLDKQGRCENCFEIFTKKGKRPTPLRPPPHLMTPDEVKAEANVLTAAWRGICKRLDTTQHHPR